MSTLIRLRRTAHLPGGTEGVLFFPAESGQSPMATLEPPASGAHPAIPAGEYALRLDVVSPRFARSPRRWSAAWGARLPRLEGVPGRAGILIHPGNRPADSSGCVLVGRAAGVLRLADSVDTFHRLMHVLHRLPPRCGFGWRTEDFPAPATRRLFGLRRLSRGFLRSPWVGRAVSPLRLGESVATFHRLMHVLHRLPPPLRIRVED